MVEPERSPSVVLAGDCEIEPRAFAFPFRFDPESSPVSVDNLRAYSQSNAGAGILLGRVQAFGYAKYLLAVLRGDSMPLSCTHTFHIAFVLCRNVDDRWRLRPILDSVADEVLEELQQMHVLNGNCCR